MIETWLQISCDGCGNTLAGDKCNHYAPNPDLTKTEYRAHLKSKGWRCVGRNDYCPDCVSKDVHRAGKSCFDSTQEAQGKAQINV